MSQLCWVNNSCCGKPDCCVGNLVKKTPDETDIQVLKITNLKENVLPLLQHIQMVTHSGLLRHG